MKKIIIVLLFLIALVSIVVLVTKIPLPGLKRDITLEYWGLWEPESVMKPLFDEYQKKNPNVTVKYIKQSPIQYRERLQNAIQKKTGPDIFRFHNTWLPMISSDLSPLPEKIMDFNNFKSTFYEINVNDLTRNNAIYGIPLGIDSLALFYNEDIFQKASAVPPTTWEELRVTASKLTVRDMDNRIKVSGVALGTAGNIDHFSDILGIMFLQNGTDLEKIASTIGSDGHNLGEDTVRFYTNFYKVDKVWDDTMDRSTVAFAGEKLAMYFGPSWEIFEIKALNPNLSFKIIPIPQLPKKNLNWATYWAEGVSVNSKNKNEAWKLIKFLSEKEQMKNFYNNAAKIRLFGEPFSRKDLAEEVKNDQMVMPFIDQIKTAKSWYFSSRTFDNGYNDKIIKYLEDMVNSINRNEEIIKSLQTVEKGISQVLSEK